MNDPGRGGGNPQRAARSVPAGGKTSERASVLRASERAADGEGRKMRAIRRSGCRRIGPGSEGPKGSRSPRAIIPDAAAAGLGKKLHDGVSDSVVGGILLWNIPAGGGLWTGPRVVRYGREVLPERKVPVSRKKTG